MPDTTATTVRVVETETELSLYRHYDTQSESQPAYIELDLREETLSADYDSEIGNAVPAGVHHGFERRYYVPVLTGTAADRVMREIAPLADRILAGWERVWDGHNHVAVLGEDAQAAEREIEDALGCSCAGAESPFDKGDLVAEWDLDGATNGCEADEYEITADTTDERLEEIETEILGSLANVGDGAVAVCHGLAEHLRALRDQATSDAAEAAEDDDES